MGKRKETICWECSNATGFCSWSREHKPVKGWEAIPTEYSEGRKTVQSFIVQKCPLFSCDKPRYMTHKQIAEIIGVCERQVYRLSLPKLCDRLREKGYILDSRTDIACNRYYVSTIK